jgi:hypothetical protein
VHRQEIVERDAATHVAKSGSQSMESTDTTDR